MSGHGKWHNIQKKKGATDAKKAQIFAKLAKAITVATRAGNGTDPDFNFQLRVAVDAARFANMPKENVDRAIKCGAGDADGTAQIEEVVYEGFGPGGAALLIKCLSDNRNRSFSEVRSTMSKNGGTLAGQGSVMWMFEQKGVVTLADVSEIKDKDGFELALIDAGAEDIKYDENVAQVITSPANLKKVLDEIEKLGLQPDEAGLEYKAKEDVKISEEDSEKIETLIDVLDELDDVDTVYTNT